MAKPTSIHSTTAAWKQSPKKYLKNVNSHKKINKEICPFFISPTEPVLIFRGRMINRGEVFYLENIYKTYKFLL